MAGKRADRFRLHRFIRRHHADRIAESSSAMCAARDEVLVLGLTQDGGSQLVE
jgi:hypothetical protein